MMDFALTFNNSQLLDDVAKFMDIVSTFQQSNTAEATQSTVLQLYIFFLICMYVYECILLIAITYYNT